VAELWTTLSGVNVRVTWRSQFPEFADQWDHAVAAATDRMEEVIYQLGLDGDSAAACWWLKHNRPHLYDRALLLKLGLLQAALAQQQSSGEVVIDLGSDGLPLVSAPAINGKEPKACRYFKRDFLEPRL
jgi:hypothetical protein